MKRIHVEGDWFITVDTMNCSLDKRTIGGKGTKQEGVELFISQGYYPTVASCMKGLLKEKICETSAIDLKGLIADVARIESDLKAIINF